MTTKVIYEVLHVFYGYAILIYSGWTSVKVNQFNNSLLINNLIF